MFWRRKDFGGGGGSRSSVCWNWSSWSIHHHQLIRETLTILLLLHSTMLSLSCNIAEFECGNKQCIPIDKYCDRVKDCNDDEPVGCSVCNRTYHGLIGYTYSLTIHIPQSCTITFSAVGGSYGDVVQLSIPLATSTTASNCSKLLEIRELDNPHHRSLYCARSGFKTETLSNYFSESNRVQLQFNFEFDVSYKFLHRKYYPNRGSLLMGTLCSVLYENCENNCTIQTPNFPGLYPTNSTCYYAIRESNVPTDLRALIRLNGQVNIGKGELRYGVNSWDCTEYVVVYDGYSIRDPVLIKFCGNGLLREVISSSNEILVQFYSGDNGIVGAQPGSVMGLNLVATTVLVAKSSYSYSENHNCLHTISSFERMRGRLVSPVHSLPENTTCIYYFQGRNSQRVWISFLKFHVSNTSFIEIGEYQQHQQPELEEGSESSEKIAITIKTNSQTSFLSSNSTGSNGSLSTGLIYTSHNTPPICEFKLLTSNRACIPITESLLSSSPQLMLKYTTLNSTILDKSSFILDYEFVQEGFDDNCNKIFRSNKGTVGTFSSTRNVLLFGRAGQRRLKCNYRFEAERGQSIRITLNRIHLRGRSSCSSGMEPITKRTICRTKDMSKLYAKLEIRHVMETINNSFSVVRECFCGDENRVNPITLISTTNIIEIIMSVENMGAGDDHTSFYFDGTFEMLSLNLCQDPLYFSQSTIMSLTKPPHCSSSFYLLPPLPNTFLSLKSSSSTCKPVIVHTIQTQRYVCLQYEYTTFSPNWSNYSIRGFSLNVLIIELLESNIEMNYLQVFDPQSPQYNYHSIPTFFNTDDFRDTCGGYKCGSIHACVHKSLYCNGISNCPGREDESSCEGFDYTLPLIVGMAILITFLATWLCCTRKDARSKPVLGGIGIG